MIRVFKPDCFVNVVYDVIDKEKSPMQSLKIEVFVPLNLERTPILLLIKYKIHNLTCENVAIIFVTIVTTILIPTNLL